MVRLPLVLRCFKNKFLKGLEGVSFVKTIIIYESSFGNTKKVAEKIRENLNLIEKNETVIKTVKKVDPSRSS